METTTPQEEVREESSSQAEEAFLFNERTTLKSNTILIKGDEVGFDGYKLARRRLENLIKSTGKQSFSSLKRAVELYLLALPLTVQGRSLRSYFKGFKRSMIDEIIESYDPASPGSSTRIYELDEDVDDNLSDDLISIWQKDIEFLSTVRTPHRFNKILRRICAKHFLSSETRNRIALRNILQLTWKEESSITDFIKTFEKLLQKCNEVELFQNTKDQMILFQTKILQQRSKNNAVFNLVNHLDRSKPELLMDYMTEFQQGILQNNPSGLIPFDVSFQSVAATSTNSAGKKRSSNVCGHCGETKSHSKEQCPAIGYKCKLCAKMNHYEKICSTNPKSPFYRQRSFRKSAANTSTSQQRSFDPFSVANLLSTSLPENFARLGSCSDVFIFKDKRFFRKLNPDSTTLQQTVDSTHSAGSGIACFSFREAPTMKFEVNALYIPESAFNILCNFDLETRNIKVQHGPKPFITLPNGKRFNATLFGKKTFVEILPLGSASLATLDPSIWHRRLMHVGSDKLRKLNLTKKTYKTDGCQTCIQAKAVQRQVKNLDPNKKHVPVNVGDTLVMDLLIPSKAKTKQINGIIAVTVLVDAKSRLVETIPLRSTTADYVTKAFFRGVSNLQILPKLLVTDRQPAFTSSTFVNTLSTRNIRIKFVPRERHDVFNGIAERTIGVLKTMSRAGLINAKLDDSSWCYAVNYAAFIKNRCPHSSLNDEIPFEKFYNKESRVTNLKIFGSLCHALKAKTQRSKFQEQTNAGLFLGFQPHASHETAIIYNLESGKVIHVNLTDVWFQEFSTHQEFSKNQKLSFGEAKFLLNCENSESDDDEKNLNQNRSVQKPSNEQIRENFMELEHDDHSGHSDAEVDTSQNEQQNDHEETIPNSGEATNQKNSYKQTLLAKPRTKTVTTRSGRKATMLDLRKAAAFTVETTEDGTYKIKPKTLGEKKRLQQKIIEAKLKNLPNVYKDIKDHPEEKLYLEAVRKEINALETRGVMKLVPRSTLPQDVFIGKCTMLVKKKRNGKHKARCVYNDFEIDQTKYINGLLKKFKHLVATPKDTPLPATFKPLVDPEHKSNTKFPYRQILGSLIYLRLTRLDLLFALHALSRFTENVTEEAIKAIKNTLGYLQQTRNLKRRFFKGAGNVQTKLIAFCDAEWAANKLNRKSVSGNLIYLGQSLVSGKSKAQSVVATSAASAELMEIHSTAKQLQGIAGLCKDLHCELDSSPVILTDSETCVNTLEKPVTAKQKHLSVQIHFLKDLIREKKLKVFYVKRDFNVADLQTKQPTKVDFKKLWKQANDKLYYKHVKV
eukprot:augustus_masked-scaffold_66-processed-gene-0.83-mRNA-1 protein AED:1.00 eAED:1.00 QI:0/0/0/0/1/1/3/0/1297